jgi:hypothetical protein
LIQETEDKKEQKVKDISNYVEIERVTLSAKNIQAIAAAQMICNVLVVIFYGNDLYSIGEVKIVNENEAKLINGVTFKFALSKLLKDCTNAKLREYLEKFYSKNFELTL